MIRDRLTHSLRAALAAAGLPEPRRRGERRRAPAPRSGRFLHLGRLAAQGADRARRRARSPTRIRDAAARGRSRPMSLKIDIAGPGFINFHLDPAWTHDVLREVVAAGPQLRPLRGADRPAGQPRVRLGQPDRARCTRAAAAGSRSATRSRTCSPRRAPRCTASTTSTTPAPSSTCSACRCSRACTARELPEKGYHGQYVVEMAERMRAELGDDITLEAASEWGYHDAVARAAGRSRAHRRALRHLVLRARAARARRRRRRAAHARPTAASRSSRTTRRGCAPASSAPSATASSFGATARPRISRAISRTTATRCGAASRT